jgi:hypothetical protein
MFELNTDSVNLKAILMLFVLERVMVKQESARKIIAHSTSKLEAEAVPPRTNTQRPLRPNSRRPTFGLSILGGEAAHCVTSVDILARSRPARG